MLTKKNNDEMLLKYLPLVKKAARNVKVKSSEYDQDDLISMGFIGLMDAIDKFDASKKVPFENYAYIRIKGSIIDEVRKNSSIPRSRLQKLNDYYKAKEQLEQELQREPSEMEVCQLLGIDDKQLKAIHETVHMLANISLDEVLFDDEANSTSRIEFIEDEETPSVEDQLINQETEKWLYEAISLLPEREQTILQLIYKEELPLKDIAYIFDISIPRVSQIHGKSLIKIREYIQHQQGEFE